ncbi:hypothetical protein [Amycolatopsis speibonae]|uniref:Transposase n=1 Tax=Amycolatopsis speibonae TaxID=1450224 RepID=A0ABV7PE36_9PSEU
MRLPRQDFEERGQQIFAVGHRKLSQWREVGGKSSGLEKGRDDLDNERKRLG